MKITFVVFFALCIALSLAGEPWRVKGIGSYANNSLIFHFDHMNVQSEMKTVFFSYSDRVHCIIITFENNTVVKYGNCYPAHPQQGTIYNSTLDLNSSERIISISGKNNHEDNLVLVYVETTSNLIGPMGDDYENEAGEDFQIVLPEGYYISQLLGRWKEYSLLGQSFSYFKNIGAYVRAF